MSESQPSQLPRKQAMQMIYKKHLDMDCLAYMNIRMKLMPYNLDTAIHLEFEFNDYEKQRF